jgi:ribose transport system substrate-binding protein
LQTSDPEGFTMPAPDSVPRRTAARWRRAAVLLATGALALAFAACGDSDSPSSSSGSTSSAPASTGDGGNAKLDEAKAIVEKASGPQEFVAPGPPIEDASSLKGRTIYWIGNANQVPILQRMLTAGKDAAQVLGMNVIVGDAKGQPSVLLSEIDKAISRKVDAIVTTSFSADSISAGLKAAKDAGIPVILSYAGDPGLPTDAEKALGVVSKPTYCYSCSGKIAAALSVVDAAESNVEEISAVSFQAPESPNSVLGAEGYADELERLCTGTCKVKLEDAPVAKWNTSLTQQTESIVRRDPKLNYMYASFDNILDWAIPGIQNVNANDRIKAIGYNGSTVPMENLKAGSGPVLGEIWSPGAWSGWSIVDSVARALTDMDPTTVPITQDRLFLTEDAKSLDIDDEASWYGDLNLESEFKTLWGAQ